MTKEAFERVVEVGDECVVVIETTSGDIEVHGWDKSQVAARPEEEEDSVTIRQEGNKVAIRPDRVSDDVDVWVPHRCDLVLRTTSGDCEIEGVEGQLSMQSMSGDLEAEKVRGDLTVHVISGGVKVRESQIGSAEIDTVSGGITLESALAAQGTYRLHSVSGGVHLRIPEDQPCTVRYHSLSGGFKCKLPHEIKRQGWGKLEALVNGGGVEFAIGTTSGGVLVEAARELPEAEWAPRERVAQAEEQPRAPEHDTQPLAEEPPVPPAAPEPFHVEESSTTQRRMEILKAIEEGQMSVTEGLARLRELE